MKRAILIASILSLLINWVFAEQNRIALSDFTIQSDNSKLKYMGRGISELIAIELSKSTGIVLIEREQRVELLKEMEISLSDMADSATQIKVGQMLTANYLVFGEIIDMEAEIIVSLRMTDVETTEIVWRDKMIEKISNYEYISGYFASAILEYFDAKIDTTTVAKVEEKQEKNEEAIISFSDAIYYYDEDEKEQAKKELEKAKAIDPENEAVRIYLNKLVLNLSKFKTITEKYLPHQNPAYLGIIQYDRFYSSVAYGFLLDKTDAPFWGKDYIVKLKNTPEIGIDESDSIYSGGYQFPVMNSFGMGLYYFHFNTNNLMLEIGSEEWHDAINNYWNTGDGGKITLGWAPADTFALGMGISFYLLNNQLTMLKADYEKLLQEGEGEEPLTDIEDNPVVPAFALGLLIKNTDSTLIYDVYGGYSLEELCFFNPEKFPNEVGDEKYFSAPLFIENTLTLSFNQRKTFFVVKQLNDIYLEMGNYYGRLMPALEHWLLDWLSFRIGAEGSLTYLDEKMDFGFGGTGGLSLRIPDWGLDLDVNLTYRRRPSRIVPGEILQEIIPLVIITKTNTFISR